MLTKYQIDHYEDFGFLALRGLLSPEEIDELSGRILDSCAAP